MWAFHCLRDPEFLWPPALKLNLPSKPLIMFDRETHDIAMALTSSGNIPVKVQSRIERAAVPIPPRLGEMTPGSTNPREADYLCFGTRIGKVDRLA